MKPCYIPKLNDNWLSKLPHVWIIIFTHCRMVVFLLSYSQSFPKLSFQFSKFSIEMEILRKVAMIAEICVHQSDKRPDVNSPKTDFWQPKCQLCHFVSAKKYVPKKNLRWSSFFCRHLCLSLSCLQNGWSKYSSSSV
jgi:hypothetical protein